MAMLARRAHIHYEAQRIEGLCFVERTIGSDAYIFAQLVRDQGYIDEASYLLYLRVYNDLCRFVIEPVRYIYLRADVSYLLEHIKRRNRSGEEAIDRSYLLRIQELYDNWLLDKTNTYVIEIERDFSTEEYIELVDPLITDLKCSVPQRLVS